MNNQFQCFGIFDLSQCSRFSSTDKFRIDYQLNVIDEQILYIEAIIKDNCDSADNEGIKEEYQYLLFLYQQFRNLIRNEFISAYDYSSRIKQIEEKIKELNNKYEFINPDNLRFPSEFIL